MNKKKNSRKPVNPRILFKDILTYYMWGFQQHFRYILNRELEDIFHMLSDRLEPYVFLIGFLREETADSHPIFRRVFSGISNDALESIWRSVNLATEQKHGTLVVVSEEAEQESDRLRNQSLPIEPMVPDEELIELITSIDDAVLLDITGKCSQVKHMFSTLISYPILIWMKHISCLSENFHMTYAMPF